MTEDHAQAFDPLRALTTLTEHKVEFVLIGGLAARLHGSPSVTRDTDICYARERHNLTALAAALHELHAKLRGVPEDVPFRLDARTLAAGDSFTFKTDAGDLDVLGTPSGTQGYDDIRSSAVRLDLGGIAVLTASLEALLRMKRAAARPKDMIEVEILEAIKDEIENGSSV